MKRIIVIDVDSEPKCTGYIASIISASLLLSHNIRRDTKLYIIFSKGYVYIDGGSVRNLRPDFESMCGLFKAAIKGKTRYGIRYNESKPSIIVDELLILSRRGEHLVEGTLKCKSRLIGLATQSASKYIVSKNTRYVYFEENYAIPHIILLFNYVLDRRSR